MEWFQHQSKVKPTWRERIKFKLISWATGKFLPRLVISLTTSVAVLVMQGWAAMIEKIPGLEGIISPQIIIDLISQVIIAVLLLTIAKWTGTPVRELQQQLRNVNVYSGAIDGYLGPQSQAGLKNVINNQQIEVRAGRLIRED